MSPQQPAPKSKVTGERHPSTRLDLSTPVERTYAPDRKAILAALRIVLRLPQSRPRQEV